MSTLILVGIVIAAFIALKTLFIAPKSGGGVIAISFERDHSFTVSAAVQGFVLVNLLGAFCTWLMYLAGIGTFTHWWSYLAGTFGSMALLVFGGIWAIYSGLPASDREYFRRPDVQHPLLAIPSVLSVALWFIVVGMVGSVLLGGPGLDAVKILVGVAS